PAPILFYQAFYRLFISNLGFIESILPLGLFLGIFPFYYGLIIADKINPKVLKSIGIVLIFFLLINSLNFINGLRAATFSLVLFSSSGVLLLIPTKKELKLPAFYRVISSIIIVFIIIGLYQLTFHFLLSFLLSLLIILFYTKKNNWLLYNLVSK